MIRRALLERLPALMREYGVMPWDIDGVPGLTPDELVVTLSHQNERWRVLAERMGR